MEIQLNGTIRRWNADLTVGQLVRELDLENRRIAVEVNGSIVPHSQYPECHLKSGDRVELIHAIGGG